MEVPPNPAATTPDLILLGPGPGSEQPAVILVPVPPTPPRPWGPWATLAWTFVCLIAMFVAQMAVLIVFAVVRAALDSGAKIDDLAANGNFIALASMASTPPIIGLIVFLIWVRRNPIGEYLALAWPSPRQAILAIVALGMLLAASDGLAYAIGHDIVPPFVEEAYQTSWLPLLLAALLIAAPLSEEVLMRGFLYRGIAASRWGPVPAILISSFVWAIIHLQYGPYEIGSIFVLGTFLGAVRWRTGSLPLTILLHAVANSVATAEVMIQTSVMR